MKKLLQHFILSLILLLIGLKTFSQARSVNGALSVSPTGAANYNISFELPSFALGFFPKVALNYSSQAPDGIAGYGWSITGISSIKLTPSTIIHDGYVKEVNSVNDKFALDGQRLLLKSGTYGSYDSTYETENYSNLKIKYTGETGYSGFIVYHPDGKKYTYGGIYTGVSAVEWALTKIEDDLGNSIEINYKFSETYKSTSNIVVSSIEDVNAGIKVEFEYDSKTRQDFKVYGLYSLKNTKLLKKVSVYTNETNLYRAYTLNHDYTETDYARLIDVIEENGEGVQTEPLEFTYGNTTFNATKETFTGQVVPGLDLAQGESLITGD